MRHKKAGRRLSRNSAQRKALFKSLARAFFQQERIETTLAKAKEMRPIVEKMITLAKRGPENLHARRQMLRFMPDRELVRKVFDDVAPRFVDRPGGYTRIIKKGFRKSDGAMMAYLELVDWVLPE